MRLVLVILQLAVWNNEVRLNILECEIRSNAVEGQNGILFAAFEVRTFGFILVKVEKSELVRVMASVFTGGARNQTLNSSHSVKPLIDQRLYMINDKIQYTLARGIWGRLDLNLLASRGGRGEANSEQH